MNRNITWSGYLCAGTLLALTAAAVHAEPGHTGAVSRAYSCVIHAHCNMSAEGRYTLADMARVAKEAGVDAVFLSDNLADTIQYGMHPLQNLLWLNYGRASILPVGPEQYLAAVDAENKRQSDVLFIPGAEVCPRFYWTGSLWGDNLVCHDHQRNIIALGIDDPAVYRAIPEASGFVRGRNTGWMLASRILPGLLLLSLLLLRPVARRMATASDYQPEELRRAMVRAFIMPLLLVNIGLNVLLAFRHDMDIYGKAGSDAATQRSLDFLNQKGIVNYLAHPEAFDNQSFNHLGVAFKVHTEPYPQLVTNLSGLTGFGGVYEDRNTLTEPGAAWDRVLHDYTAGQRTAPMWCFGEMLYHYEGQAGKKISNVETMVWADKRDAASLLESLRRGRFYARANGGKQKLTLDAWNVSSDGALVEASVSSVIPGEKVQVLLVRNGVVVSDSVETTPFNIRRSSAPDSEPASYRLLVKGKYPLKLVSNPQFVQPAPARR